MGLLTADQKTAMASERPLYALRVDIYVPASYGGTPTLGVNNLIHADRSGIYSVVDAGRVSVEGYNLSLAEPGRLTSGHYAITVDNSSGKFYPTTSGNWFYNSSASYQADPIACWLSRNFYIRLASGTWSELTMLQYIGKILTVTFDDDRQQATIETVGLTVDKLKRAWRETDGATYDTTKSMGAT